VKRCNSCHGQGVKIVKHMLGPGIYQQMQTTYVQQFLMRFIVPLYINFSFIAVMSAVVKERLLSPSVHPVPVIK
jgi:hypothetical protein